MVVIALSLNSDYAINWSGTILHANKGTENSRNQNVLCDRGSADHHHRWVGDLVNWNQVSIRKYEMSAAFDGKAPWGDVGPESGTEKAPTVLYRKVGQSYCYTAFQVPSLRDRLESENKLLVSVSTTCSRPSVMKAGTHYALWTAFLWPSATG